MGLLVASFPMIYWLTDNNTVINLLLNKWFWYGFIAIVSYLMVSSLPMLALKFKGLTVKAATPFILIAVLGLAAVFLVKWLAVPVIFIGYVLVSLLFKNKPA